MFVLIVGAGRVGSSLAKWALAEGHEVSVLDEDPLSLDRLNQDMTTTWEDAGGRFTVGTALEVDALNESGIDRADVCIICTDGDNTNLVVGQLARRRFEVDKVIVRVLDPLRAEWYREQGLETICPTQVAIEMLKEAVAA
jgi:trk system potassium uptake protein